MTIIFHYRIHYKGTPSTERQIVAAFDLGTTTSGYAYAFRHEWNNDARIIHTNKRWLSGNPTLLTLKTPTTLLLTPEKKFHAFGYVAESKYAQLMAEGSHKEWFYFRRFKMMADEIMVCSIIEYVNRLIDVL